MKNFSINDFLISNDDDICLIYYSKTGELKIVGKKEFKIVKELFDKYKSNELAVENKEKLENFLSENFIRDERPFLFSENDGLISSKKLNRLEIMLTTDCNLRCGYCYASGGCYNQEKMIVSSKEILSYLERLIPLFFNEIGTVMFFGGEPLLNPNALETVCNFFSEMFKQGTIKKLPHYTIITNGTLIDEKISKILKDNNVQVTVSIDGSIYFQNILRPYLNGKGSFNDVCNGINILKRDGVNLALLEVTYTSLHAKKGISKKNIENYLKKEFGNIEVLICNCTGSSKYSYKDNSNINNPVVSKEYTLSILRSLKSNKMRDLYCDAGLRSLIISVNGDVYPCHLFISNNQYKFGNVYDDDLFKNDKYNLITSLLHGVRRSKLNYCSNCSIKEFCTECPAALLSFEENEIRGINSSRCKQMNSNVRANFIQIVKDYAKY